MKNATLDEILNDPEFASLLDVSKEEQELQDKLFKGNQYSKQTLEESMAVLGYNS